MHYDYVIDVVSDSKACIAGYTAVQTYTAAVRAYYRHIQKKGWAKRERKEGAEKEERGREERERGERKGEGTRGKREERLEGKVERAGKRGRKGEAT